MWWKKKADVATVRVAAVKHKPQMVECKIGGGCQRKCEHHGVHALRGCCKVKGACGGVCWEEIPDSRLQNGNNDKGEA